jgi:hypothetical protein
LITFSFLTKLKTKSRVIISICCRYTMVRITFPKELIKRSLIYSWVISDSYKKSLKIPKWIFKSRKSKKDRQHNGQKKKENYLPSMAQKTKDRATRTRRWIHVLWKGNQFLLHMWHPSCYSFWYSCSWYLNFLPRLLY